MSSNHKVSKHNKTKLQDVNNTKGKRKYIKRDNHSRTKNDDHSNHTSYSFGNGNCQPGQSHTPERIASSSYQSHNGMMYSMPSYHQQPQYSMDRYGYLHGPSYGPGYSTPYSAGYGYGGGYGGGYGSGYGAGYSPAYGPSYGMTHQAHQSHHQMMRQESDQPESYKERTMKRIKMRLNEAKDGKESETDSIYSFEKGFAVPSGSIRDESETTSPSSAAFICNLCQKSPFGCKCPKSCDKFLVCDSCFKKFGECRCGPQIGDEEKEEREKIARECEEVKAQIGKKRKAGAHWDIEQYR